MNKVILNNVEVEYLDKVNLRYLFTEEWNNLPNLPEDNIIYCIVNGINNKCYIGQTLWFWGRFIGNGFTSHLSEFRNVCISKSTNRYLYNAFRKYGCRNFTVYILESLESRELLNERESYWIKTLHTCRYDTNCNGYNMTWGGDDVSYLYSEESINKSIETRIRLYWNAFGQAHTKEALEKGRLTKLELYGTVWANTHTEEANKKRIETNLKLYGDPIGPCHTPEAISKMLATNASNYNGDVMGQCNTPEARLIAVTNMRVTKLLDYIESYLDYLHSIGIKSPITWNSYWMESGDFMSNPYRHLDRVKSLLPNLKLSDRWTAELDSIFNECDV